mmetsp:Transcript_82817/g.173383  ORF Transcript_82817/g.173383 Transcript_82817/m.173383 type:complete len:100 (+) Transcript_82817:1246-1545(+)
MPEGASWQKALWQPRADDEEEEGEAAIAAEDALDTRSSLGRLITQAELAEVPKKFALRLLDFWGAFFFLLFCCVLLFLFLFLVVMFVGALPPIPWRDSL